MSRIILCMALLLGLANTVMAGDPIVLKTDGGALYGTLEVPKDAHTVPVALIISGSGPTDRDGNNPLAGKNNSLKMLAEDLAAKGIASLRYDKRGIAESAAAGPKEADLRFDTYIEDAEGWGRLLMQDRRFTKLIIIGHSEGALIGVVACRGLGAQGFISIAGTGYPAFELLETQLKKNLPPGLLSESNRILDLLKAGTTTDKVPSSLMTLFRPSVQPYLISWFRYDPVLEVSRLKVPALIVQGTTDIQVSTSDAERLAKSNKLARLLIVEGMNHVLKSVPNDPELQMKSYNDPDLPVSQELADKMGAFVREAGGKK
ncbi:MAG: Alpha/beta hydrolase family protein [Syntrophorhabdus sp. PtaU1.Bin058]|nr:MAG: Alpha/beta hydrolase family protein [Syntrophorhabdus sp. PtaU1.Bin058]